MSPLAAPFQSTLCFSPTVPLIIMNRESTEAAAAACLLVGPEEPSEVAFSASITFHVVLSTAVALCGSFMFGNALGFSSPAESGIIQDLGLSLAEYSLFGSILSVGAIVGALWSGRIADLIGRRGAMWVSDVICILGWLLIGFAQDALCLYCGRALLGCGISFLTYAVPVYIAEITPKNLRGGFTALHEFVLGCSSSIAYLIGSLVNWRIFALLGLIPCLIQFLGLLFIPESPRWLVKAGQDLAFEASLSWLRGKNVDISSEAAEIKDYTIYIEQVTQKRCLDMFQRKYAHCLIVGVGLMVFQQFGGMRGVLFYTTGIFKSAGFPGNVGSMVSAATKIIMGAAGVLLLTVYGRRPLLLVSAAGACMGALITGLSFLSHDIRLLKELRSVFFLIGVVVFIGAYELGLGSIPWIIMSEVNICGQQCDIPYKHQSIGGESVESGQLARLLGCQLFVLLSLRMELCRNFLHLFLRLWCGRPVYRTTRARDEGTDAGGNTSLANRARWIMIPTVSSLIAKV